MKSEERPHSGWGVILAGGTGQRLASVARKPCGEHVPKQFFDFGHGHTLLDATRRRLAPVVAPDRTAVVVLQEHERFWRPALADHLERNVVVQPRARGTGLGVLLPLAHLAAQDRDAVIVLLPSDHVFDNDTQFHDCVRDAQLAAHLDPRSVILLGVEPTHAESEYGWIVPGRSLGGVSEVAAFVEKPPRAHASELMEDGGLWNSSIVVAHVGALLSLFARVVPKWVEILLHAAEYDDRAMVDAAYEAVDNLDFSHHVLQAAPENLRVQRMPACGWSDVGSPERLASAGWLPTAKAGKGRRARGIVQPARVSGQQRRA
jgi:mannose-1-phosphate guanylyltransferase